jgi:hypothetical protein
MKDDEIENNFQFEIIFQKKMQLKDEGLNIKGKEIKVLI